MYFNLNNCKTPSSTLHSVQDKRKIAIRSGVSIRDHFALISTYYLVQVHWLLWLGWIKIFVICRHAAVNKRELFFFFFFSRWEQLLKFGSFLCQLRGSDGFKIVRHFDDWDAETCIAKLWDTTWPVLLDGQKSLSPVILPFKLHSFWGNYMKLLLPTTISLAVLHCDLAVVRPSCRHWASRSTIHTSIRDRRWPKIKLGIIFVIPAHLESEDCGE